MCGGAILSDIIPPPRRVTGGHLWRADKKKRASGDAGAGRPRCVPEEEFKEEGDAEFEADFEGFQEDVEEEHGAENLPARSTGVAGDGLKATAVADEDRSSGSAKRKYDCVMKANGNLKKQVLSLQLLWISF